MFCELTIRNAFAPCQQRRYLVQFRVSGALNTLVVYPHFMFVTDAK